MVGVGHHNHQNYILVPSFRVQAVIAKWDIVTELSHIFCFISPSSEGFIF